MECNVRTGLKGDGWCGMQCSKLLYTMKCQGLDWNAMTWKWNIMYGNAFERNTWTGLEGDVSGM